MLFLTKIHLLSDPSHPIVELEWQEFQESIALDASDKRWWDYRGLFITSNARWRSLMMIMMGVFGQFSGNGLGYFNSVIYNNLGYTSPATQLLLNLIGSITSAIGAGFGVLMTDIQPRRTVLVWGTAASAGMLAINVSFDQCLSWQPSSSFVHRIGWSFECIFQSSDIQEAWTRVSCRCESLHSFRLSCLY
jgi:predicted MFS family arabinose efflux permease